MLTDSFELLVVFSPMALVNPTVSNAVASMLSFRVLISAEATSRFRPAAETSSDNVLSSTFSPDTIPSTSCNTKILIYVFHKYLLFFLIWQSFQHIETKLYRSSQYHQKSNTLCSLHLPQTGLGSRQIFFRLRLLTFFSSGSGSGFWFFSQTAPSPAPVFFSSGSGSGSKEPKTPGSDRLRLLTIG